MADGDTVAEKIADITTSNWRWSANASTKSETAPAR